jgi:hypothetical protein
MGNGGRFRWGRVVVAVIAAEALPILLLVVVVFVYGLVRRAGSRPPEEFAPVAGMWVGPIGGFVAVLLMALWAAKRASHAPILHGLAVGIGAAVLDLGLGIMMGGSEPVHPVLYWSTGGRVLAGVLGGWMASRTGAAQEGERSQGGEGGE